MLVVFVFDACFEQDGHTALHVTSSKGKVDCVNVLVAAMAKEQIGLQNKVRLSFPFFFVVLVFSHVCFRFRCLLRTELLDGLVYRVSLG